MLTLRSYQQEAHDAAVDWMRKCKSPCLIDAVTGAGKSLIIAAIAKTIRGLSDKRCLVIQPSAELLSQNLEKYQSMGGEAGALSASYGEKDLSQPVTFGTPLTIKNHIDNFDGHFGLVVIDECHGVTKSIRAIVDNLRAKNPNLRVLGLTATPYRMGTGYIYKVRHDGKAWGDEQTQDPYFAKCVYSIGGEYLIERGYLTRPLIGGSAAESYNRSALEVDGKTGLFTAESVEKTFVGQGRLTSKIVADVVHQCENRRGVMFFASTVKHALEIMESLPPDDARMVTGETPKPERRQVVSDFKAIMFKYLVNVGVYTTGFDAQHVDCIAILRATESVSLLQQIVGRGLRIFEGKDDCLVLDFAGNMEAHCKDGLFNPEIRAKKKIKGEVMDVICKLCKCVNEFTIRPNDAGFAINSNGNYADESGEEIQLLDGNPSPAHFGRRCNGIINKGGDTLRCEYRFQGKHCNKCEHFNDIAARRCEKCKAEIVDPNSKLFSAAGGMKKDPRKLNMVEVTGWQVFDGMTKNGQPMKRIEFQLLERSTVKIWVNKAGYREWDRISALTHNFKVKPKAIAYERKEDGFYKVTNADPGPPP